MKNVRLTAAAAALALASPALATNGMRMIGFGPVQNSMGGVSAAVPLDATTAVTNPAGLSALRQRVDLAGTAFVPTVRYRVAGAASGQEMESERPTDYIPTLAGVYRVEDRLTLGFAALGTAGVGVEYPADLFASPTYTSYLNMRVAPAAAYRVTDKLSVGLAANLMYARLAYEVASADVAMNLQPRDAAGALGVGATVGLTFAVTDAVTLAAAYESKSFFQSFAFDVPAHTINVPGVGAVPVPGGTEELDFDQPQVATIGAAVRPIDGLVLAADVQWIDWSDTNGENRPVFDTNPQLTGAMAWNLDWSDQVVLKVGGQYALPMVKGLAVRAGYNYGASPLSEDRAFENVAFPAIAEHHFTVGAGYDLGTLTVNVGAQYSPEAKLTGGNAQQGIAAYETTMSQLAFDLGVAYRF